MGTTGITERGRNHHEIPLHELLLLLGTDPAAGLTQAEAEARLARYGPNELPRTETAGWLRRLLRQMHNPLVYVLLAAGIVTLAIGELTDSTVIFGVVALNTVIGYVQETKAESALDALRRMVHTRAHVVRDGVRRQVRSEQVVPGDLVVLAAGDKVPADLRIVSGSELEVDESALTGESLPVAKDEVVLPASTAVADRRNMAYSSTLVTRGTGAGLAVATGGDTEIGQIHRLVGAAETLATPLTRKLAWFSKLLTVVILALAAVTFGVGVWRGEPAAEMFTAAVALAVGAIPEGLPAAVTITLAIGVARMARRRAVIRRLPAVETLGGATVICTDKTGTLTENRMTVRHVWTLDGQLDLPTAEVGTTGPGHGADHRLGEPARWSLLTGANCTEARVSDRGPVGDPTDVAMLRAAESCGFPPHGLDHRETVPFSSERRYMASRHVDPATGGEVLLVKGAVERVLPWCEAGMVYDGSTRPLDRESVLDAAHRLASRGMRVLATAYSDRPEPLDGEHPPPLTFTGLQAMLDPPRSTARSAVAACRSAGIEVKMVTGDHAATAAAIASDIGLTGPTDGGVLTGADLERLGGDDLADALAGTTVLARVSPAQKLRLVEALQDRGHVVAMTGDGVNDAPALRQADLGVAMGHGGTEVAKEAGDMVLTDDDFATIEAAVEEGRGVFDNLTKFIVWTLPTNMGEGAVILVAILLGTALPILPTQILWINMTTAVALGLTLAWEPKEPGIMTRRPRAPDRPLLTGALVFRTALVSALLVAGSWWLFEYETAHGASLEASRTAALNVFVVVEAFYLLSCRSLHTPVWRIGWLSNRWLLLGVAVQAVGQAAITYLPAMNDLFHTAPLAPDAWLRILAVAVGASLVVAVDKWWRGTSRPQVGSRRWSQASTASEPRGPRPSGSSSPVAGVPNRTGRRPRRTT